MSQQTASTVREIWIDVGAHLGEKTFPVAEADSGVRVYAFEPNLSVAMKMVGRLPNFVVIPMAVGECDGTADFYLNSFAPASSLLGFDPDGLAKWIGRELLEVARKVSVPVVRLDTFMDLVGISQVEFLKIDAQGADFAVVRSAGKRLRDIRKITLEVQITPLPLYAGGSDKDRVVEYLRREGFDLVACERQTCDQEENLTFLRQQSA